MKKSYAFSNDIWVLHQQTSHILISAPLGRETGDQSPKQTSMQELSQIGMQDQKQSVGQVGVAE